ncbi:hypothetical protein EJF36_04895 [Bacillus sp. HMF5848]|uniref:hypothetical protein n=1 Tax=Bacillus sp. HMF5848 TaxID=2495421 RepID=UPI000F79D8D6|nr:hypothetical protein [Bacillus sp. HMF5848]RSK26245.1 hypothetical protein EJF36_04895 [Bacillus sp. HMF5848]
MRRMFALAGSDIRQIQKDPILVVAILLPVLFAVLIRFALPVLTEKLNDFNLLDLSNHYDLIIGIGLLITPIMMGFLIGFIVLDERDEELLMFFSITPLTKTGYVYYRLISPILLTFVLSFVFMYVQGIVSFEVITFLPIAVLNALGSSLFTMAMVMFASNKVEGLALSKVLNLTLVVPIIPYIFKNPVMLLFGIVPTYWPVMAFVERYSSIGTFVLYVIVGFVINMAWLIWMTKKFENKIG